MDIANPEDVGGVYIGARKPGLHFFEQRNGLRGISIQVIRETEQLRCLTVIGIGGYGFLQEPNRFHIVALLVVSGAEFEIEPFRARVTGFEVLQFRNGVVDLALLRETAGFGAASVETTDRLTSRQA